MNEINAWTPLNMYCVYMYNVHLISGMEAWSMNGQNENESVECENVFDEKNWHRYWSTG